MASCKNGDDSIINIENLLELNYLCFKGGGGKGIAYLGPIEVLNHEDVGLLPLKLPIKDKTVGNGQGIIGISGTSAGAITAYLVALGLDADEIRNESGLIPARKNPFYDPNYDPNMPPLENGMLSENEDAASYYPEEEYWPGDNASGFNFEHFITKDAPEIGYKRAVVYDDTTQRNRVVRCVDAMIPKAKKVHANKVTNKEREKALAFGFTESDVNNVHATLLKKEIRKLRASEVHPAFFKGEKESPILKEAVKELFKERRSRLHLVGNTLDKLVDPAEMSKSRSAIERKLFEEPKDTKIDKVLDFVGVIGNLDEFIAKQFRIPNHWLYLYNILYDQGLFPGFAIQDYFADVTSRRLPVVLKWSKERRKAFTKEVALEMTFAEFYKETGLDLVIAGLNVVNGNQRNFSYRCSPDFPVIAAVMMSMNIPGLFKPVYVDAEINKSLGEKEAKRLRAEYRGYYVDAGLANNFPMHVFDDDVKKTLFYEENGFNGLILGLAVQEGPDPKVFRDYITLTKNGVLAPDPFFQTYEEPDGRYLYKEFAHNVMTYKLDPDYLKDNFFHLLGDLFASEPDSEALKKIIYDVYDYNGIPTINGGMFQMTLPPILGWILNTVLINTTDSQTRETGFHSRVLDIYAYHISITDFKPDDNLTEFVIRRAREKTIKDLKLKIDPNTEFK